MKARLSRIRIRDLVLFVVVADGWTSEAFVRARWQVTGGMQPYSVVIDREPRDVDGEYTGPSGTAKVGCGDTFGGTYFEQRH